MYYYVIVVGLTIGNVLYIQQSCANTVKLIVTSTKLPLEFGAWSDASQRSGVATTVVSKINVHRANEVEVFKTLVVKDNRPEVGHDR